MSALYNTVPKSDPLHFWAKRGGLDYSGVSKFLDFDKDELSKLAGVSRKTVRLDDRIPRELKERLEQMASICNLVAEFFEGDAAKTALWFRTANPMLGDVSPRDMIRYGRFKRLQKFILEAREDNAASAA